MNAVHVIARNDISVVRTVASDDVARRIQNVDPGKPVTQVSITSGVQANDISGNLVVIRFGADDPYSVASIARDQIACAGR